MTEKFAYCAYWEGKCQAIAADTLPDLKETLAEWINDGATEIRKLPVEEAKDAFQLGYQ